MKAWQKVLFRALRTGQDIVLGYAAMEARVRRLAHATGVELNPPEKVVEEVTPAAAVAVLEAYRECDDDREWLWPNGPRDQVCIEYHLTPAQVRGVVAAITRGYIPGGEAKTSRKETEPDEDLAFEDASDEEVSRPEDDHDADLRASESDQEDETNAGKGSDDVGTTEDADADQTDPLLNADPDDSSTWPSVPVEEDGDRDRLPKKAFRQVDDVDRQLILLVHEQCAPGTWPLRHYDISKVRRLRTQQIVGVVGSARTRGRLTRDHDAPKGVSPSQHKTFHISSWEAREAKGGLTSEPPSKKEYTVDDVDREIAHQIVTIKDEHERATTIRAFCAHRRLTTKQVSGLLSRKHW